MRGDFEGEKALGWRSRRAMTGAVLATVPELVIKISHYVAGLVMIEEGMVSTPLKKCRAVWGACKLRTNPYTKSTQLPIEKKGFYEGFGIHTSYVCVISRSFYGVAARGTGGRWGQECAVLVGPNKGVIHVRIQPPPPDRLNVVSQRASFRESSMKINHDPSWVFPEENSTVLNRKPPRFPFLCSRCTTRSTVSVVGPALLFP